MDYIILLLLSFLSCCPLPVQAQEAYNILWLSVEDMSPHLNCYGDSTVPTPNINRLAAEGVRYTNAYATYGVCAPSRHTIITGMYPTSTGAMAMRTWTRTSALDQVTDPELLNIPVYEATPPPEVKCFSEYFRAAGYYCTNNSKTDYQFRPPLTAWDESSKEAHWRKRPDDDMPFFAVFNNTTTHESGTFKPRSPRVVKPADIQVPPYYPDIPEVREDMARHFDNIHAMDGWVGEKLQELEAAGLMDKTIIVFFSDHGDGLPRAKRWVYDSGIKIPLIVRWPDGRQAGTVNDELVSFIDFAPSMLSLAGLDIPDYMQGQVFLGENKATPRQYIYAFRDRMDPAPETIRAVRDERYKYIRNYRPDLPYLGFVPYRDRAAMMQAINRMRDAGQLNEDQWQFWADKKPLEELYDTANDPHEIHNLAAEPAYFEKLAQLRQAHFDFTEAHGDLGMIPETDLINILWPPNGKQPTTEVPELTVEHDSIYLQSPTKGASIAYRFSADEAWQLYTQPLRKENQRQIEVMAHRIGWKPSEKVRRQLP
jgi:arylsulfatase A-like enzyme